MDSSLYNPTISESSQSQGTVIHSMVAPSSTFNNVGHDQYNITGVTHIYQNTAPPPTNSPSASQRVQNPFNDAPIDNLSIHFTGRKRELALIAKAFEGRRDIPLRCALHGNQGVGKSQLTYSWANSSFASKENAYIMWISATTVEKLFQGFCRLLRFVDHPDQSHPDQNARLDAARRWLEEIDTGNWLLVFDNVFPETVDFLRQNLPRVNGRGTILFTTRTREVATAVTSTAGEQHEVIEVPLLSVAEGVELFCGHFAAGTMDPSSAKIEAIVTAVGRLPLAIAHAAAYTNQSLSSLDDVLELYQSEHKMGVIGWEHTLSSYEHKSVAATFISQLQDLDRHCPDAGKLLRVLAFFDPESIPLEMLITGAKAMVNKRRSSTRSSLTASMLALIQSPVARQHAINHLQSRCLVAYHATSHCPTFRIHDLIRLVVLENSKGSEHDDESFELAVDLACSAFQQIADYRLPERWPRCELLVPHIQSLALRQNTSSEAKAALFLANLGRGLYLTSRGRYAEAESLYQNIIAEREQLFGLNDLDTFVIMQELASVYQQLGRDVDAELLLQRVLEARQTQLGPTHRKTLLTMCQLADVYYIQGRYGDAETLLQQTLQSQQSQFGSEDDDTLVTMSTLAIVYRSQQRYHKAKSLLTTVLQAQERLLGSQHRFTLLTKLCLASVYLAQNHCDTAAVLFQQVVHAWERDLGSQHPDTLRAMYSLACVYASQERFGDAENLVLHVLAARQRIFGNSHPGTQNAVDLLAWVYEKTGRWDDATMTRQRISQPSS